MEQRDFEGIWRLRAVFCEGVVIEGDPAFKDMSSVWMWFAGDPHLDEWFAVALTDDCKPEYAIQISAEIEDADIAALLPYAGEPWINMASTSPVMFGTQQRTLYAALKGSALEKLIGMDREQIVALRGQETPADKAMWN